MNTRAEIRVLMLTRQIFCDLGYLLAPSLFLLVKYLRFFRQAFFFWAWRWIWWKWTGSLFPTTHPEEKVGQGLFGPSGNLRKMGIPTQTILLSRTQREQTFPSVNTQDGLPWGMAAGWELKGERQHQWDLFIKELKNLLVISPVSQSSVWCSINRGWVNDAVSGLW